MPEEALAKHMKKCSDRPAEGSIVAGVKRKGGEEVPANAKRARHSLESLVASRTTSTTVAHLSDQAFDSLGLHPLLDRSVFEVFKYTTMTQVQADAIPIGMKGGDLLAKAKTGTGKTLAFLLSALHRVLSSSVTAARNIQILVLSPTRELAMQTAEEATGLLFFVTGRKVMTALGGTNMRAETASFQKQAPLVLVATPGRLDDHLNNSGLAPLCAGLSVLIFDEADQLLDMGFRPAIEKILKSLPSREKRQTLLFSATFPAQLASMTKLVLKSDHKVIDCIGAVDQASNEQVEQSVLICSLDDLFAKVTATLIALIAKPHKIIVFLPTARETGLFSELFTAMALETEIMEIHSRKSQNQRTKISEQFRVADYGILFSSDVSARGMDYPDVTYVLQVGAPSDRAQYLHRLGRTARAGRGGAGLLILCDFERYFLKNLDGLPWTQCVETDATQLLHARSLVKKALPKVHARNPSIGPQAYQAWMGQQKAHLGKMRWSQADLVQWANYFATDIMGLAEVPALEAKTVGMMGLRGVPGIVVKGGGKGGGNRRN